MADGPKLWLVGLCEERPEVVRRWVHYHLNLGVHRITICFDEPRDPLLEEFASCGQVECIAGDEAHWESVLGHAPESLRDKIHGNLRWILRRAESEAGSWVAALDMDELLYARRPLREILETVNPGVRAILARVLEAVPSAKLSMDRPFGTRLFKAPLEATAHPRIATWLLGPHAEVTSKGLLGHSAGKSLYRASRPPEVFTHHGAHKLETNETCSPPELRILHFDAMYYEHWRSKWERRTLGGKAQQHKNMGPHRLLQAERIRECLESGKDGAAEALFRKYYALRGQRWRFRLLGLLQRVELHPGDFDPPSARGPRGGSP